MFKNIRKRLREMADRAKSEEDLSKLNNGIEKFSVDVIAITNHVDV